MDTLARVVEPPAFDWRNPDYTPILAARVQRLRRVRAEPQMLAALGQYYRTHIADFINDWGVTADPRNALLGRPVVVPFLLFPRQRSG